MDVNKKLRARDWIRFFCYIGIAWIATLFYGGLLASIA